MTEQQKGTLELFHSALEADRAAFVRPWLVSWAYQDDRRRSGAHYQEGQADDFLGHEGPSDLLKWMRWTVAGERPDYFGEERLAPLVDRARATDRRVLSDLGLSFDDEEQGRRVARHAAQDYLCQNLYPVPGRQSVKRLLDFGAGYGRQANLWTQLHPELCYVGMDAIPQSYCVQALYYARLGVPVRDYVQAPRSFTIDGTPGIDHLPTWRMDLLPEGFFDMVLCVQVLQELSARLVREMLARFHAVLKVGGALYIRDHGPGWQPVHALDVEQELRKIGFELEFSPHVIDGEDLHGIPRIWRKRDPAVLARRQAPPADRRTRIANRIDRATGGLARKLYRGLRHRLR